MLWKELYTLFNDLFTDNVNMEDDLIFSGPTVYALIITIFVLIIICLLQILIKY